MPERIFPRGRGAMFFLVLTADALLLPAAHWLDVLCAGLLTLVLALGWFALAGRLRIRDGFALLARLPASLSRAAALLIALLAAVIALRTAGQLAAFLQSFALPGLPVWLAGVVILCAAWLLARNGPPALFLWALPIAWTAGAVIILSIALSLPDWTLPHTPLLKFFAFSDIFKMLGTVFAHALFLLLFTGYNEELPEAPGVLTGIACSSAALGLTGLRAIAVLGMRCAAALPCPAYSAAGVFAIGDFLQRSESIFGAALSLCFLARAALLLCAARECFRLLAAPQTRKKAPQTQKS